MNCEKCGQPFEANNRNGSVAKKRFCSEKCRKAAERKRGAWSKRSKAKTRGVSKARTEFLMPRDGLCGACQTGVVSGRRKYCSESCYRWAKRCWDAGYELTIPEYEAMKAAANGRCQACGVESDTLQIDHCHTTGSVRGLICGSCNSAIAHAKDSSERLVACAEYLRRDL